MDYPLKFRQRLKSGEWYEWGFLDGCFVGPITNQEPNPVHYQYTGVMDKAGSEICAGDIVGVGDMVPAKVIMRDGAWRTENPDSNQPSPVLHPDRARRLSILGNCEEHPELLEV